MVKIDLSSHFDVSSNLCCHYLKTSLLGIDWKEKMPIKLRQNTECRMYPNLKNVKTWKTICILESIKYGIFPQALPLQGLTDKIKRL